MSQMIRLINATVERVLRFPDKAGETKRRIKPLNSSKMLGTTSLFPIHTSLCYIWAHNSASSLNKEKNKTKEEPRRINLLLSPNMFNMSLLTALYERSSKTVMYFLPCMKMLKGRHYRYSLTHTPFHSTT